MMRRIKKVSFATVILIALSTVIMAQGTASISGSVKDSNGAVVLGATVTALNIASSQRITVSTDSNGKYQFTGLRGGTYRLVATSQGFAETAETVVVDDGASISLDFAIAPGSIKDVVTVTVGRGSDRLASETPQTVSVTTSGQIEQRLPTSTFGAMERAPNVGMIETNPARQRPRLRGLAASRVLIVIDGERVNNARADPGATGAPVSVVEPSQLESIEVVGGAGSSLYGSDAIGGVINLITKAPTRSADGSLLVGLRLDGNYGTNGRVGRGNVTLNASNDIVAARASFNIYRNANYKMGNGSVSLADNIAMGNFFRQFPTNAAGTTFQAASSYPIFALSPNQEIVLGEGHGDAFQFDMWFYPANNHNFRGKAIRRTDGYNGNAFSGPPYETQERFGSFRDYSKFSFRYEALDLASWIARFSSNVYYQKLSFPQGQFTWVNLAGATGSYTAPGAAGVFTGLPSIFVSGVSGATFTDNRNSIGSTGIDIQATMLPFRGMLLTVGGGRTRDNSRDYFINTPFTAVGSVRNLGVGVGATTIGSSTPVSNYTDNNFYIQGEFDRFKYIRLTGGMRFDKWVSEGLPGNGFPLGTEFAALNAAIPGLTASPGNLTSLVAGLPSLVALAGGTASAGSETTSKTYNFGIVGRLPYGINPYFRWANSYREPGITERFLIRNFTPGLPGLASMVVGNLGLKPEKGENYDAGVKVTHSRFNFSLGYFRNEITDLLAFAPAQTYCVAPLPGLPGGAAGGCASTPATNLGIQINARINVAAAVIKGWESTGEASIPIGIGSLNPFYSLGSLHGTNKSPTPVQIRQFNTIYNRTDTPIRLTGSLDDFPLGGITPFRIVYGVQFLESKGRFFAEYDIRRQNRVTRADPGQFVGTALINFGSFASMNAFDKQAIKAGYTLRRDRYRMSFNAGIDNIADKLYWEHFQNAPAPGRSFVFGITTEIFNFFSK